MRTHKLLTKIPGDLEHAVKFIFSKESTLDEISNTLQEVRIRTPIGRYNTHRTDNDRENLTFEAKEAHEPEELNKKKSFHSFRSPNHYGYHFLKDGRRYLK
ncbi:hypothetical protein O181_029034 [Austropuccinia psidii MF-1]|uniref:Uncharacterized protein n=1 Tax=Austropuccinia psidii MF-1 TaxID=1389203 RepID=A0A9Q3CRQ2_9BASI|nr:hypothetical protein [Austropuccinia psidii MF-1]